MSPRPAQRRSLGGAGWLIVALALVLRLYYISVAQVDHPLRADAGQYFIIAHNVLESGTFSTANPASGPVAPDSYRAPGYPAVIALASAAFGDLQSSYWAVLILQCLLGTASVALTLLIARRMMPLAWALLAAGLAAVWPHLITLSGYVLTETLFGFLLALAALFLVGVLENATRGRVVAAAASLAAAALVNEMALGFTLAFAAWLLVRRRWSLALLFAVVALGPSTLWAVRDSRLDLSGDRSSGGRLIQNVLVGMEPDYVPWYRDTTNTPAAVAARARIEREQRQFAHDPDQLPAILGARLADRPWHLLAWYAAKPFALWRWGIEQGAGDIYVYPMLVGPFDAVAALRVLASVCHGLNRIVMLGAFAGLILVVVRRRKSPSGAAAVIAALLFGYVTAVQTLLMPDARYAVPFRPFEFLLAVWVVAVALQSVRARREAVAALPAADAAPGRHGTGQGP